MAERSTEPAASSAELKKLQRFALKVEAELARLNKKVARLEQANTDLKVQVLQLRQSLSAVWRRF